MTVLSVRVRRDPVGTRVIHIRARHETRCETCSWVILVGERAGWTPGRGLVCRSCYLVGRSP